MEDKKYHHRVTAGDAVRYLILTLFAVYTLMPLYFLLVNAFKSQSEIVRNPLALPQSWNFSYLQNAADKIHFLKSLGLTFVITAASIALIVVVSSLAAWMMVRNKTKISGLIFFLFVSAMLIPFQSIMYPLLSFMDTLGLKNTPGLIVMYGGFGLSMSVFLYHGFIKSVPQGIEEAAVIDGANILQVFFLVVFPLLKSTTVTVIILNGMWIWNDYLLPFLVIGNAEGIKTLTLELYFAKILSGQYGSPWELIFPAVLVSVLPIILVFLSLQKYFIKGISDGAVKT
ncbi:carbohydrate ABC transporter permease [Anaerotruncus sp. AF02-27]|uniref:carbohydrate ABC transporter permease n=1 Tax=Anaerotruncus TaxID=244127 RepID=UPI000E4A3FA9|nr:MULTISPECIES: carbohydrate ABC transporter permease [Anaerotruncus]RGX55658.1 carbohydrate ABC transporter permease [Anaerotruncus sp. AF02-27]